MTALIVIAAIILFFALALNVKLRVRIRYIGGEFDFRLKYLWFIIYPFKKNKRKKKKEKAGKAEQDTRKKKGKKDISSENESAEEFVKTEESMDISENADTEFEEDTENIPSEKKQKEKLKDKLDKLSELIEKIKIIWGFSEKRLRRIFTHIYIENLMIDFVIAGDDACKTAVSYGTVSAAVYNGISIISTLFRTKVKSVDISCDFEGKKPVYDAAADITARPSTLFAAVLGILGGFIINYKSIMGKSDKRQSNEAAAQL